MERTRQGQEKEEWGMLKQIKVITVYLHRNKSDRTYRRPHLYKDKNDLKRLPLLDINWEMSVWWKKKKKVNAILSVPAILEEEQLIPCFPDTTL